MSKRRLDRKGRPVLIAGVGTMINQAPDHESQRLPPIVEIPPKSSLAKTMGIIAEETGTPYRLLRSFRMGDATLTLTRETGEYHLSIARPDRLPSWPEIAKARYSLMPKDRVCVMVLPPVEEYVNIHKFCFQILELPGDMGKAGGPL